MAIKPKGYGGATIGPGAPVPRVTVVPKAKPYNPQAYVPGGSAPAVARAIQTKGFAQPGPNAIMAPTAPIPTFAYGGTTQPQNTPEDSARVPANWGAYLKEIENDPVYTAALGNYNTNQQSWRRQLASAIGNAVTQGGWDITGALQGDQLLKQYAGDVTPEVAAAAAANQLSTNAMLQQEQQRNLRIQADKSAAQGVLGSGAQAAATTSFTNQNVLAQNQAQNELLQALRGSVGSFLEQQAGGLAALEQTRGEVAARLAALEGATYGVGNMTEQEQEEEQVNVPGTKRASEASGGAGTPQPFGGVVSVRRLANGSTLTTYANGRQVQQAPGKNPYVVTRGG